MSKEDFVKFYEEHVLKTSDLQARLKGAKDQPEFGSIAMAEGSKLGLKFTADEIGAVMTATENKLHLSDEALEKVVGGAATNPATPSTTIAIKTIPKIGPAAGGFQGPLGGASLPHLGDWGGCW